MVSSLKVLNTNSNAEYFVINRHQNCSKGLRVVVFCNKYNLIIKIFKGLKFFIEEALFLKAGNLEDFCEEPGHETDITD